MGRTVKIMPHIVIAALTFSYAFIAHAQYVPADADEEFSSDTIKRLDDDINDIIKSVNDVTFRRDMNNDIDNFPQDDDEDNEFDNDFEMLADDALQLRGDIVEVMADVDGGDDDMLEEDMKNIERDADNLKRHTDSIRERAKQSRNVKTRVDVDFERGLEALKSNSDRLMRDAADAVTKMKKSRKKRRRRKERKERKGKRKGKKNKRRRKERKNKEEDEDDDPTMVADDPVNSNLNRNSYALGNTDRVISPDSSTSLRSRSNGHYIDTSTLRRYLHTCEDCMTLLEDSNQCPLSDEALEMKKWATELQELVSFGCTKPEGCTDPGVCCVAKDPRVQQTMTQVSHLLRDLYNMLLSHCSQPNCPGVSEVKSPWAEWGEWSDCDVTCGLGYRRRNRGCNSRRPQDCVGDTAQTEPCPATPDCCVDGNWSSWTRWSQCSATCSRGQQSRRRTCSRPAPNYCGNKCPGPDVETQACGMDSMCCVNGNWGSWTSWTSCSATCGRGSQSRIRRCDDPSPNFCGTRCPGRAVDRRECGGNSCCMTGNWVSWSSWSVCSQSCGSGVRYRVRSCDTRPQAGCGEPCMGDARETEPCANSAVNGNWGFWQPWSQCSVTCGRGRRTRRRACDSPSPNACGMSCAGDEMEAGQCDTRRECCVDGNWGSWQRWSQCSATCGRGVRERLRSCDSPPANDCGQPCFGPLVDRDNCETGIPCLVCVDGNWGNWQAWSQCSVTCGRGFRERLRSCDSPAANECGRRCPGDDSELERCDTNFDCPVCVDGNWGSWQRWSECSVTCGSGFRERLRSCDSPPANDCGRSCPGNNFAIEMCDTNKDCLVCVDGNWGMWQTWSECSATCGRGRRERTRSCDNPPANECGRRCPGDGFQSDQCDSNVDCCVDGNWGTWQTWSECSATCGRGRRERTRACDNPPANECGRSCPGSAYDEGRCRADVECPVCVDGNWGMWQTWSECSATCGRGLRERTRSCDDPPANNCGRSCPGRAYEEGQCSADMECPVCVDGNWGSWQTWSECSVTCGRGTQQRFRSCDNPPANNCGRNCPGDAFEMGQCNADVECPVCVDGNWGSWLSWSQCTVTCGRGTIERRRLCDNPPANSCGRTCPGKEFETETCINPRECESCVDGNWGAWEPWNQCSTTCGTGIRERKRSCNNPPRNYCGQPCPGRETEADDCRAVNEPCPITCVNGNWGSWSAWSTCPDICGDVTVVRSRTCSNPPPNYCGKPCEGEGEETKAQRCGPDPIDGQWSSWTPWTACSATCGIGSELRSRECNSPPPNVCGKSCPGPSDERRTCQVGGKCGQCAERMWSSWTEWGECTATCGEAMRSKTRVCQVLVPGTDCGVESDCPGPARLDEPCFGLPDCPSWGEWSACSATCRGKGVRERVTIMTIRERGDMTIQINATNREVEECYVDGPECPYSDPAWSAWDSWCPCDCKQGVRTRRRECQRESITGDTEKIPITLCSGDARDEESCNAKLKCPECIKDCEGLPDGEYPSCTGCNEYVICQGGGGYIASCVAETEWDAFISKCGPEPSPSCTLHNCVSNCTGRLDGFYHDCYNCRAYTECIGGTLLKRQCEDLTMEWNQHRKQCQVGASPTCKRQFEGRTIRRAEVSIIGGGLAGDEAAERRARQLYGETINSYEETVSTAGDLYGDVRRSHVSAGGQYMNTKEGSTVDDPNVNYRRIYDSSSGQYVYIKIGSTIDDPNVNYRRIYDSSSGQYVYTIIGSTVNDPNVNYRRIYDSSSGQYVYTIIGSTVDDPNVNYRRIYDSSSGQYVYTKTGSTVNDPYADTRRTYDSNSGRYVSTKTTSAVDVPYGDSRGSYDSSNGHYVSKKTTSTANDPFDLITYRHRINNNCIDNCDGLEPGKYASCRGCKYYVLCTAPGKLKNRRCTRDREWDDNIKRCKTQSTSCTTYS